MDEQINRIRRAEDALDRAQSAVDGLEKAWDDYRAAADDIRLLGEYLNSEERRADIEADESGALPDGLRRGVLSQDAIWNLLEQHDELIEEIRSYINRLIR